MDKETFTEQLNELQGDMSRAEASRKWDIPYRTLADWQALPPRRTPRGIARAAILDRIRAINAATAPTVRTRTRNASA